MSNHWDVFCVDCDAHMDLNSGSGLNHGEELVQQIIDSRNDLAALVDTKVGVDVFLADRSTTRVDYHWLSEHIEHVLAVRSEYGYLLDDCHKHYFCESCGTTETCRRKKNHDGDCDKKRDYTPGAPL